jgi:ankyrin repeat protein
LDSKQSTPAHEAAKGGHFEVLQVLSGFGAKFDVYDVLGNNPIHYGASSNAGTAIRFLGQRGMDKFRKVLTVNKNIFIHRL